jgi:hypothetical protein
MGAGEYRVVLFQPEMAEELRNFVRQFWRTSSYLNSEPSPGPQNRISSTGRTPTFLFLKDTEVIGHVSTIPVRLCSRSAIMSSHWVVGFMVLPEYRNGLIGPLLIRKVNETLPFAMTLHVEDNVLKIFKGLGWRHFGVIPQFVRVLNCRRLVDNVRIGRIMCVEKRAPRLAELLKTMIEYPVGRWMTAGMCAMLTFACLVPGLFVRPRCGGYEVVEEQDFSPDYDMLWDKVKLKLSAAVVRDRSHLLARYGGCPGYRILACRSAGRLLGYCLLKVKMFENDARMGNARIGTIVDCLFDPEDSRSLHAMLEGAVGFLRREQVDAVFCTASLLCLQQALQKQGFLKVPGNLNFACYSRGGEDILDVPLPAWHLMRGDSDAAENF